MDMDYEISIISGSYGGHRQRTSDDGQLLEPGINIGKCRIVGIPELFFLEETFIMFLDLAVSDKYQQMCFLQLWVELCLPPPDRGIQSYCFWFCRRRLHRLRHLRQAPSTRDDFVVCDQVLHDKIV